MFEQIESLTDGETAAFNAHNQESIRSLRQDFIIFVGHASFIICSVTPLLRRFAMNIHPPITRPTRGPG